MLTHAGADVRPAWSKRCCPAWLPTQLSHTQTGYANPFLTHIPPYPNHPPETSQNWPGSKRGVYGVGSIHRAGVGRHPAGTVWTEKEGSRGHRRTPQGQGLSGWLLWCLRVKPGCEPYHYAPPVRPAGREGSFAFLIHVPQKYQKGGFPFPHYLPRSIQ